MFVDFVHGRYGILLENSQFLIMQMCKSLHYHSDKSPDSDSMMLGPISTVMERWWLFGYLSAWARLLTAIGAIEDGTLATSIGQQRLQFTVLIVVANNRFTARYAGRDQGTELHQLRGGELEGVEL